MSVFTFKRLILLDIYCLFLPFLCLRLKYLVVFNSVVAETLSLSKALWDLLRIMIWVDTCIEGQVPVYLGEGLRTVHVGLPYRTTRLGTVTALMVDWACRGKTVT